MFQANHGLARTRSRIIQNQQKIFKIRKLPAKKIVKLLIDIVQYVQIDINNNLTVFIITILFIKFYFMFFNSIDLNFHSVQVSRTSESLLQKRFQFFCFLKRTTSHLIETYITKQFSWLLA